jgi:phage gpG-like protein
VIEVAFSEVLETRFTDVAARSYGHHGFVSVYVGFNPLYDFGPSSFVFFAFEQSHRPDFKRLWGYFLTIKIQVEFGTATAHVNVQVLTILEGLHHHIVDELGFFAPVNDVDFDARFFGDTRHYLTAIGRLAHGRSSASHKSLYLVEFHEEFVALHEFGGARFAFGRDNAVVEHVMPQA